MFFFVFFWKHKKKLIKNLLFLAFSFDLGTGKGAAIYRDHYFHYMIIVLKKSPTKLTLYVMKSKPPIPYCFTFILFQSNVK